MAELNLQGIFPAVLTPYQEDGGYNVAAFRRLLQHLAPNVDGFVVNGTTGDFPLLTREERLRALEIAVEVANGEKLVIAGTGAVSTWEAIQLTQDAYTAGADAALVIAPYYLRPSVAGLRRHFADLAAAIPKMPLILYNFPKLVGQPIPVHIVAALAIERDNIVGIKDTSGNLRYMLDIIEATQGIENWNVLVGQGTLVLPSLSIGAAGAILAAANLIPAEFQALLQAMSKNDLAEARRIQSRTYTVACMVSEYGSLAVRAGLEFLGFEVGKPRRPLTYEGVLGTPQLDVLHQALQEIVG
ncbi:MAG: dihydrodipicolinate synthase family protein [Anaerolineae bacterium]|nr:dihydrodipicolinate synthase family protein [Anaerolineae bacterium]